MNRLLAWRNNGREPDVSALLAAISGRFQHLTHDSVYALPVEVHYMVFSFVDADTLLYSAPLVCKVNAVAERVRACLL